MALSEENGNFVMPVAPTGGNGMFGGGDSWAWIVLLLLFAGGFGGNGFGGGNNLYPWLNQTDAINAGFQNSAINSAIGDVQNSITSGFGNVQTALCGGFAGVNASITNASMNAMQNAFAQQTAMAQGFSGVQSQLAQCCCDNRLATVQTQNIVQTEGANTRIAIETQTRAILDKLCQQEIDAKNDRIAELERQLSFANLSASQTAQTQYIVDALKTTATTTTP